MERGAGSPRNARTRRGKRGRINHQPMRWLAKLRFAVRSLFAKQKLDEELSEEICTHVDMATEANLAAGMTPEEARYAALREFGNVGGIQERAREGRGWVWLEQVGQDAGYAFRQLRRNPGFTATIVLILALGIGANIAVFTLIDALLFRPLPVRDAASLQALTFVTPDGQNFSPNISAPLFRSYQARTRLLEDFTGYARVSVSLRFGERAPAAFFAQLVPGNYFQVLKISPFLGRLLVAGDDAPNSDPVVVLSHDCWQGIFGSDPTIVGKAVHFNKQLLTVVGVGPPGFYGLNGFARAQAWVSAAHEKAIGAHTVYAMVGRVAAGATVAQAEAELGALTEQIRAAYGGRPPPGYERYGIVPRDNRLILRPAALGSLGPQGSLRENSIKPAGLFAGAVVLVLLAACANAANLLLVRALARRREIAVRLSLGATRFRLLRQFLVESLGLAGLAGLGGLLLGSLGIKGLLAMRTGNFAQITVDASLDGRTLIFAGALSLLTGLVFGLLPARRSLDFDLHTTLKQETPGASARHRRFGLRNLMVLAQVAAGLVLLAGAGLCLRSFANLIRVDPGFDTRNVLTMMAGVDRRNYPPEKARALVEQTLQRAGAIPGVRAVSLSDHMLPLSGNTMRRGVDQLEDYTKQPGESIMFDGSAVGPGYFGMLGISLRQGREFGERDGPGRPPTVLINESFAQRFWPGKNPLGKRLEGAEVIGVVADTRSMDLRLTPEPRVYSPILRSAPTAFTVLVKTEGDPALVAPQLRRALEALDPAFKSARQSSLQQIWFDSMTGQRMSLMLLGVLAAFALLLTALGLYGFVACSAAQRTREIGIRVAVGAQWRDIQALVIREAMTLVLAGLAMGLAMAGLATRAMEKLLYGISPTDLPTFAAVTMFLVAVALLACWLPARRAAKIDPVIALRAE